MTGQSVQHAWQHQATARCQHSTAQHSAGLLGDITGIWTSASSTARVVAAQTGPVPAQRQQHTQHTWHANCPLTRMCAETHVRRASAAPAFVHRQAKIVKEDGVAGLFRGGGPTVVRAMALNMGMWPQLCWLACRCWSQHCCLSAGATAHG
jgi:hypothetical protein